MTIKEFQQAFHTWKTAGSALPDHAVPKTIMSDKSEKDLKSTIQCFAKMHGFGFLTYDSKGRKMANGKWAYSHMTKGAPDCILFIPADTKPHRFTIVVHVEIKMPGDRQREHQKVFQRDAESRGERYIMPRSWESFFNAFQTIAPWTVHS